jgi:hypothetical protein
MSRTIGFEPDASDATLRDPSGVLRLAPAWVPREFCTPGKRIRLHPDDYFAYGAGRGGIDERWLASTVRADNGPKTTEFEGLSLVVATSDDLLLPFDAVVDHHGADIVGQRLWRSHQGWPMYAKFFDNQDALPFHVHQRDMHAALVGKPGKPEAYYYPPEMNNHLGLQPVSFLGIVPSTTPQQLADRLRAFGDGGDNRITDLAPGYRTILGTGWDVPAGVLHAPASVCTYEPQAACDVFAMFESWSNGREVDSSLLWKDVPPERRGDFTYAVEVLDWTANTDPDFVANRFMRPFATSRSDSKEGSRARMDWIVYRSPHFSAKRLELAPGASITLREEDAFGLIAIAGFGSLNGRPLESATAVRFGALTNDEYFVPAPTAVAGVEFVNASSEYPLVVLLHYGPGNVELAEEALPIGSR